MIYEIYTSKKALVYSRKQALPNNKTVITKAVQQSDGSFWMYVYYQGQSMGTPVRSKIRQIQIEKFINEVKQAIN